MTKYKNIDGDSSIVAYDLGDECILVEFSNGRRYMYSYQSAGVQKVEQMKKLAIAGNGLNSYIMKYARNDYVK